MTQGSDQGREMFRAACQHDSAVISPLTSDVSVSPSVLPPGSINARVSRQLPRNVMHVSPWSAGGVERGVVVTIRRRKSCSDWELKMDFTSCRTSCEGVGGRLSTQPGSFSTRTASVVQLRDVVFVTACFTGSYLTTGVETRSTVPYAPALPTRRVVSRPS
jgi:hypothetical protein